MSHHTYETIPDPEPTKEERQLGAELAGEIFLLGSADRTDTPDELDRAIEGACVMHLARYRAQLARTEAPAGHEQVGTALRAQCDRLEVAVTTPSGSYTFSFGAQESRRVARIVLGTDPSVPCGCD